MLPALLLLAASAPARAEPIVADRPRESISTSIVQPRELQLEGGVRFQRFNWGEPNRSVVRVPEILVRTGVTENIEVRLGADGFIREFREDAPNVAQGSDLVLGAKFRFNRQHELWPSTGALLELSFPTGGRQVTSDGFDPSARTVLSWRLGERVDVQGNMVFALETTGVDDGTQKFSWRPSLSVGTTLSDGLVVFVEYFGRTWEDDERDEHSIGGGLTYRINDDLQLDLSAALGFDGAGPAYQLGLGASWRFRFRR